MSKRKEIRLIAGDSITVDGVEFVAVKAFTARVEAPDGYEWRVYIDALVAEPSR